MIFLQPIYNILAQAYTTKINHFALIKLSFLALDKTLLYFLFFALFRLLWLLAVRHRRTLKSEAGVWVLSFYLILLLMVTTFRNTYFPWQLTFNWSRSLSEINLNFMRETWKLAAAPSFLDFVYNSLGNVLCFLPFGFLIPLVFSKKESFLKVVIAGVSLSLIIEALQFILATGVSDIDDVFFNMCGVIIGYLLYLGFSCFRKRH